MSTYVGEFSSQPPAACLTHDLLRSSNAANDSNITNLRQNNGQHFVTDGVYGTTTIPVHNNNNNGIVMQHNRHHHHQQQQQDHYDNSTSTSRLLPAQTTIPTTATHTLPQSSSSELTSYASLLQRTRPLQQQQQQQQQQYGTGKANVIVEERTDTDQSCIRALLSLGSDLPATASPLSSSNDSPQSTTSSNNKFRTSNGHVGGGGISSMSGPPNIGGDWQSSVGVTAVQGATIIPSSAGTGAPSSIMMQPPQQPQQQPQQQQQQSVSAPAESWANNGLYRGYVPQSSEHPTHPYHFYSNGQQQQQQHLEEGGGGSLAQANPNTTAGVHILPVPNTAAEAMVTPDSSRGHAGDRTKEMIANNASASSSGIGNGVNPSGSNKRPRMTLVDDTGGKISCLSAAATPSTTTTSTNKSKKDDDDNVPKHIPPDFWYWLPAKEKIGDWDVLCGRGGESNNFIGNKKYRSIVNERKDAYRNIPLKQRKAKTSFVRNIVQHVNNCGGRFVDVDSTTGRYYVVTMERARKKTSQALRETKELKWLELEPKERKSSSNKNSVCPFCKKLGHKTRIAKACLYHHEWVEKNNNTTATATTVTSTTPTTTTTFLEGGTVNNNATNTTTSLAVAASLQQQTTTPVVSTTAAGDGYPR